MKIKRMIFIVGPTASGKTSFAEELARAWKVGLINADVAQMYTALSVGTAKPGGDANRGGLFDLSSEAKDLNAIDYRDLVVQTAREIEVHGEMPLVVGGALFYVKQLLCTLEQAVAQASFSEEALMILDDLDNVDFETWPCEQLFEVLKVLDEARAVKIGVADKYRLCRALDIVVKQRTKPSCLKLTFAPVAENIVVLALLPKKSVLESCVMNRLEEMLGNDGGAWLQEIATLRKSSWEAFAKRKGFVGYAELFAWAERGSPLNELAEIKQAIFIKTRQYIKKQLCFWRGLKKQIVEADKKKTVEIVELSAVEAFSKRVFGEKWNLVRR